MTHVPETGAGEALTEAVIGVLGAVKALNGPFDGPPLRSAFPYATVEAGLTTDWSHKSGAGREVRLTVTIRDAGERPARLRRLTAAAEAAVAQLGGTAAGWRIVSVAFQRSRVLPEREGRWASVLDYRARMLAD